MEQLTAEEARVLGCLIEKERTTPEYYPMTVNALIAACNQKTNRSPVVDYDETLVEQTLRSLDARGLIGFTRASGGRTTKYLHRAADGYEIDPDQTAVMAVLLLRGPQTPGELRARTERYFAPGRAPDIDSILDDLMSRAEPLVERLAREPGQKEHRFATLITEASTPGSLPSPDSAGDLERRVEVLEWQLRTLAESLGVDLHQDEPEH